MKFFGVILILFSLIDTILVIMNHAFKFYIFGYQELINFLTCPIMLIGLYYCSVNKQHITIDLIPMFQNEKYRNLIGKINTILIFLMFCILFAGAINACFMNLRSESVSLAFSTPMYYYDIMIAFFLSIFIFTTIKNKLFSSK